MNIDIDIKCNNAKISYDKFDTILVEMEDVDVYQLNKSEIINGIGISDILKNFKTSDILSNIDIYEMIRFIRDDIGLEEFVSELGDDNIRKYLRSINLDKLI